MLATFVRRWEGQSCLSFHNRLSVGAACLISLVWVGPDDRRNLESLSRSALRRPLAKTGRRLALLLVAVGRYPENGVYAAAALSEQGYISRARQCERGVAGVGKDGGIKARLQAFRYRRGNKRHRFLTRGWSGASGQKRGVSPSPTFCHMDDVVSLAFEGWNPAVRSPTVAR